MALPMRTCYYEPAHNIEDLLHRGAVKAQVCLCYLAVLLELSQLTHKEGIYI